MCIFQVVVFQNESLLRKSPITLCVHFYACTFCNLLLKTLLEGERMQVQSPPEHPNTQQDDELQAPVKAPLSFPSQLRVLFHAPGFIS